MLDSDESAVEVVLELSADDSLPSELPAVDAELVVSLEADCVSLAVSVCVDDSDVSIEPPPLEAVCPTLVAVEPLAVPSASASWFCVELVAVSFGSGAVVSAPCSVSEVAGPPRLVVLSVVPVADSLVELSVEDVESPVLSALVDDIVVSVDDAESVLSAESVVEVVESADVSLVVASDVEFVASDVLSLAVAEIDASRSWSVATSAEADDSLDVVASALAALSVVASEAVSAADSDALCDWASEEALDESEIETSRSWSVA